MEHIKFELVRGEDMKIKKIQDFDKLALLRLVCDDVRISKMDTAFVVTFYSRDKFRVKTIAQEECVDCYYDNKVISYNSNLDEVHIEPHESLFASIFDIKNTRKHPIVKLEYSPDYKVIMTVLEYQKP